MDGRERGARQMAADMRSTQLNGWAKATFRETGVPRLALGGTCLSPNGLLNASRLFSRTLRRGVENFIEHGLHVGVTLGK